MAQRARALLEPRQIKSEAAALAEPDEGAELVDREFGFER
jgi:hypothetical protein